MKDKTILGCWCTNVCGKFIDEKHIQIELIAHIWCAYDNDSKTDVINKEVCFVKEIDFGANDEVEITEEDKKIKKLDIQLNSGDENKVNWYRANNLQCEMAFKINEIIEKINRMEK